MTLSRLREARSAPKPEQRAGGGYMSNYPYGVGLLDPSAVPPPGSNQIFRAGVPVTAHTSLQTEAVFTAMRIITASIIKLGDPRAYTTELSSENVPYRVWQEVQPPILYDTFGPGQFQFDGRRRTIMSMGLFGEAFWHIMTRDRLGYPTALEVLHPLFMEVKPDSAGFPIYKYGSGSRKIELDPEDVVHIPFMSMPGGTRGLNSIEYGSVTFALALAAIEYGERWFSQGASPSFVLTTPNKLGRDELERVAEKFLIDHSGLTNSHLPLIVDGGMQVEKIQATPDEAQFLSTLEFARSAIAAFFGIPSFLMPNILERQAPEPPGTIQERSMAFLQYTLSAYLVPLEEAYSSLIPDKVSAAFDTTKFAEPAAQQMAAEIMALRNTQTVTINDIRTRWFSLPPLSDPRAEDPWTPLASNVAPEQTPGASPPKKPGAKSGPGTGAGHDPEPDPASSPDDSLD